LIPQDKIDKNKLVLLNKLNNIEIVFITPTEIQYKYSNVNKIDTDIKQIKY